jgi:hypothetical protein
VNLGLTSTTIPKMQYRHRARSSLIKYASPKYFLP